MRSALFIAALTLAGCSYPGGPPPSLAPRAAEAIDPRAPVVRPMNDRPVDPALAGRLAGLVAQARNGDAAFQPAAVEAERLSATAGAAQSESWISAQQALTAAIAARGPTVAAIGDIDALGANKLQIQGGLAPADLAAIQSAGAEVSALDNREAAAIKAIQGRLGL